MSWYKTPEIKYVSQKKYLKDIETIFKVLDAKKRWVPYNMEPHQVEWHLSDVTLLGPKAKHKIVVKSRNTSFTISSIISVLMSVPFYPNQVIPVVRLNQTRANDLINDFKEHIKHMNVIREKDGTYFPFDPREVNMEATGSIKFPNGVEIRAFPATNSAAETIRGLRIAGCAGIIDESNFMKDFESIYIALRDAAAGSIDGEKEFQIIIGTTRKGRGTPFNLWFEGIEKIRPDNMEIFRWPVFDPYKVDLNTNLLEQELIPIVKWHDLKDLENKRKENLNRFKEEYMAILVDGDDQFYEFYCIQNALEIGEKYDCKQSQPEKDKKYYMGIDPSSGVNKDYFAIVVYEKIGEYYLERYVYYTKNKELPQMEEHCIWEVQRWNPHRCRIDSVGVGTQISQKLVQLFGTTQIEPVKGQMTIKGLNRKIPLGLNEFLHTNQKTLMANGMVGIINDELQIQHYSAWNNDYKSDSGIQGHGDLTMASGYALLPDKWKFGKGVSELALVREKATNIDPFEKKEPEIVDTNKPFREMNIQNRIDWYKKQRKIIR